MHKGISVRSVLRHLNGQTGYLLPFLFYIDNFINSVIMDIGNEVLPRETETARMADDFCDICIADRRLFLCFRLSGAGT